MTPCGSADLGWHIFKDDESKLSANRLRVIGGRGQNMNDFDSGLVKDLINKGIALLSIFSLVGSVV